MLRRLFSLLVLALALAACAAKETTPAPAAPAAAPAAPAPAAPEAKPAWQEEWERVLAAAKREGRVAVVGPTGATRRQALTEPFEKKYGIAVEFQGAAGPDILARIKAERAAGQYVWDIYIGGTSSNLFDLKPAGIVDPLEPALILPEVKDPKNWLGGQLPFADKDRMAWLMTLATTNFAINTNLAKAAEFKSYKDFLDPKWKGKIVLHDPRIAGAGQAYLTFAYQSKELGPAYIQALARHELTLSRDYRQPLEWVAQGRFAIAIGINPSIARQMEQAGAPITQVAQTQMKEGGFVSSGVGTLGLVNKAPHPNAAKAYVNWLLGKEGQTEFSRGSDRASTRVDVPTDHLHPGTLPRADYFNLDTEEARTLERKTVAPFVKGVFGE